MEILSYLEREFDESEFFPLRRYDGGCDGIAGRTLTSPPCRDDGQSSLSRAGSSETLDSRTTAYTHASTSFLQPGTSLQPLTSLDRTSADYCNTVGSDRHALREMDIELMRKLSSRVNVIPVIGRSDSLTPSELKTFKKRVMEDIEQSVGSASDNLSSSHLETELTRSHLFLRLIPTATRSRSSTSRTSSVDFPPAFTLSFATDR